MARGVHYSLGMNTETKTKTPAPTCKTLHTRCSGETPADYEYCEPSDWSAGMFAFSFCCRTPAYKAAR